MKRTKKGRCYLIHFDKPFKHARHYLGFVDDDSNAAVDARYERHINGQGARLTQVASEFGIEMQVVRVWPNVDRHFERKLKRGKNSPKLCPICNPKVKIRKVVSKWECLDCGAIYGGTRNTDVHCPNCMSMRSRTIRAFKGDDGSWKPARYE